MTKAEQIQALFVDVNTIKARLNTFRKMLPVDAEGEVPRAIESALFMNESLRMAIIQLDRKVRAETGAEKV